MDSSGASPTKRLGVARLALEVLRVYRRHWALLVPVAVVVLVPQTLVEVAAGPLEIERVEGWGDVAKLALVPASVIASLVGEAFYAGVVSAAVLEWRAGRRLPRLTALARTVPYRRLVVADLILAVGAAIGLLLLVVPGLVFLTYFFIVPAVIKLEGVAVRDGFRRSVELVRGSFRRVFSIVVLTVLGTEAISDGLAYLAHGGVADIIVETAVDATLEPLQGLVTVLLALALIELHGGAGRLRDHSGTS